MGEVATIDSRAVPTLASGGRIAAIVPQTMEDAYRLAKAVCMAGMSPKGMDTPEKCMIAIMRGMEIGLTPFQALDKIAIVNGRPTIWGDGALGLVRGSGLCEYVSEAVEGEGDKRAAVCETKRKGERSPIRRAFSVADAKKAGLWGKAGPWQQFPDRMLQMRARAFCLRDGFADVLGGLYLKEELDNGHVIEGESAPAQATAPTRKGPPAPPPPPPPVIAPPTPQAPPAPPPEPVQSFDFEKLRSELRSAPNEDAANEVYDRLVNQRSRHMTEAELDECDAIMREACAAFAPAEPE